MVKLIAALKEKFRVDGLVVIAFGICASACTSVSFYEETPDGKLRRTGMKYYAPKPYLLVTRAGEEGKVIGVKEVFLPDTSKPQYGVHRPGWGKANFGFKISNGVLTEFSNQFDSQGAETLTSLGSLATGVGGLAKNLAEANGLRDNKGLVDQAAASTVPDVAITEIANARANVEQAIKTNDNSGKQVSESELKNRQTSLTKLEGLAAAASTQEAAKAVAEKAADLAKTLTTQNQRLMTGVPNNSVQAVAKLLLDASSNLGTAGAAIKKTIPPQAPPPVFELYEVVNTPEGSTSLKKVKIPQ